jgi:YgiT-type zinc finger domain-containing protein
MNNITCCPLCGGTKEPGQTTFAVDTGAGVVVVRAVPATVCSQCGEEWIDDAIAEQLEQIVQEAKDKQMLVEIATLAGITEKQPLQAAA